MDRPKIDHRLDSVGARDGLPDRCDDLYRCGFADEQALSLPIDEQPDRHEQQADGDGRDRVPRALAGERRKSDPDQRDENTDQRAEILEEDDDDLRRLRHPEKAPPAEGPFRRSSRADRRPQ